MGDGAPGFDCCAWHSRGYLPHFDGACPQHVVFHLADSLPRDAVARLDDELRSAPDDAGCLQRRRRVEEWLDTGIGACLLRDSHNACVVEESLLHFDGDRYRLFAWAVMPNHVHVLFEPLDSWSVGKVVGSWKRFMATRIRGNAGARVSAVWHREYWDRFVRSEEHFGNVVEYIHWNPVKAGLVKRPNDWPWSSARLWADGRR